MTHAQKEAYQRFYSAWCLPYNENETLDFSTIFGNENPIVIEIGFGTGEATALIAKDNPQNNYLCIEVFKAGIASLLGKIEEYGLTNIRIMEGDAVKILEKMILPSSIFAFHFFFPDPWQKKRHNKRRFIKRGRTDLLQEKLKKLGFIYMVTDWEDYALDAFLNLKETPGLASMYDEFAIPQDWRPKTKFERRALKEGRKIFELLFQKITE
ncbi:MAG: tRNA (guanosine(46)-N7)-methyltransferase TrmB [Treponema sp.]